MQITFAKSTYARINHLSTLPDPYLLERYIFPGLEHQAPITGASDGISLPTGKGEEVEYISLAEAKQLILDWLIQNKDLPESKQNEFKRIGSFEKFSEVAHDFYQARVESPGNLATAARLQNVEALQNMGKTAVVNHPKKFNSDDVIREYNKQYLNILSHSYSSTPAQILNKLFPTGVTAGSDVTSKMLAQVIAENLARLERAGSVGKSEEAQDHAVAKELTRIISTRHKVLSSYLNYLGDPTTKAYLRQFTTSLAKSVRDEDPDALTNLESLHSQATTRLDEYLLNESELRAKIYNTLPLINEQERVKLTDSILKQYTRSSFDPQTLDTVLANVGAELKIGDAEKSAIHKSLTDSGLSVSLNYRQEELFTLLNSRYLTRGEINLVKKGINPFLVTQNLDLTVEKEKTILAKYNEQSLYQNKPFITLREAYEHELGKDNPDPIFLAQARSHLNRVSYYASLSPREQGEANRTRLGRTIANARSRAYELQNQFFDKWIDIEETVTGKKWLTKQLDRWDKFAETYTVKFGKTNIPIFRLKNWVFDQWDKWKQITTHKYLAKYSKSTSWFGKFAFNRLKDYELGSFTLKGATFVATHRAWSWIAYKASAGIIKEGAVFATRTAIRLLIKLGGKTLAKAGMDAVVALAGLAGGITTVLSIAAVIDFVVSLGKFAWDIIQRFVPNKEAFVATVATIWAGVAGFFATFTLGGLVWPVIVPIALVLSIGLGSLGFMTTYYKAFNTTIHLDSGPVGIFTNIVCTLAGTESPGSSSNPKLAAGKCVFELLSKAGINPLNRGNAATAAFNSFATGLGNGAAADEAKRSATDYATFQCVGFDVVVSMMTGGSGGFSHAKFLDTIVPPGYRFVAGVGSCSPGDFFVDKNGDWGHTGLFVEPAGANIVCLDANSDGLGTVRDETTCRWPTSAITGCLKAN